MATKSKLKTAKKKLSREHKDTLLKQINDYTDAFAKAANWATSKDSVAYVKNKDNDKNGVNYIYEFYCYIRIACDLTNNYYALYQEGIGKNKHKFPQAASHKVGKPKFIFYDDSTKQNPQFQYCAGVKINGKYKIENDHPDISFQLPLTDDHPGINDVIMIFDAKFQMDATSNLDKGEIDKFETIVRRLKLNSSTKKTAINFKEFSQFEGNCLLTNALFHHDEGPDLDERLKDEFIKEVQQFYPMIKFKVAPK